MKIFLAGANGFIGQRLASVLVDAGHDIVCGVRDPARTNFPNSIAIDFARDHQPGVWAPRLRGVDAVVNLVGILRECGPQTFSAVHDAGPRALFAACLEANVRRVVHLSALGADRHAQSQYHLSKRRADEFLAGLPLDWTIVQPSLVFGPNGSSARLFMTLAALPLIPLPGRGEQLVQPIHVDDLCRGLLNMVESGAATHRCIAAVGPAPVTFREMLAVLRRQLGMSAARFIAVPMPVVRLAAKAAGRFPAALFDLETVEMLERGNVAPAADIEDILKRPPKSLRQFIAPTEARVLALAAKSAWLLALLRVSIGLLWIATGIVSLGLYPVEQSYSLLARVGLVGPAATVALYGAATLDLALGIAVFTMRRRRWLWRAQIALIITYSAIIAWALPELWLHPFGPLLKNIPLLAAIAALHELER